MISRAELKLLISTSSNPETERQAPIPSPELTSNGITLPLSESAYLGEGLYGVVMKGKSTDGKEVAVKLFLPQSGPGTTPESLSRMEADFWKETELLPQTEPTHHLPRLITRVSFSTPKGPVEGFARDLLQAKAEAVTQGSLERVTKLVESVADALEFVWEQHGLIVYDVSPDNIMVRPDGDFVLSDLNLASDGHSKQDAYTEGYVAPEVANLSSRGFDRSAATYSLAMTAFSLLGGQIDTDPMASAFGQDLAKPASMPQSVFDLIQKATDIDPEKRPTPNQFATSLSQASAILNHNEKS